LTKSIHKNYSGIHLPHPADQIMADFVEQITSIDPQFVEGVYLTGSLPMNDFFADKSDIDFIVLCKTFPDKNIFTQLQYIHKKIAKRFTKTDLNGTYLTTDSLFINRPEDIPTATVHEGSIFYSAFELAPISLSELKTNAITIVGQKAETLQVEIKQDELNKFLHNNINSYWRKWLDRHSSYFKHKPLLLLLPRLTEWSVLGVARQLCTLQTGKIVSKTKAGLYCLENLPDQYHPIIKEALEIRRDNRTYPFLKSYSINPSFIRMIQTIECVNYIISIFNSTYENRRLGLI
jgi:hypothetical protein